MDRLAQVPIGDTFNSPFSRSTNPKTVADFVTLIVNYSYVIAGVFILFALVFAGFQMVKGAGSGDQQAAEKAKKAATGAAIGFVVIFTSYWIIKIIEVITGQTFVTNPF